MGLRFQKRLRVFPGVHLVLSKSGVSLSLGVKGASVNLSERGAMTTVSAPGTGLSWRSFFKRKDKDENQI